MSDQQHQRHNPPRLESYQNSNGESSGRGSAQTFIFDLDHVSSAERAAIEQTVTRLVEEHQAPSRIIYTTLTGRTAEGLPFAEVTLLPVGDRIRLTLGHESALGIGDDRRATAIALRRLVLYLLSSYLTLAYDFSLEDVLQMCELADQEAERAEAEVKAETEGH